MKSRSPSNTWRNAAPTTSPCDSTVSVIVLRSGGMASSSPRSESLKVKNVPISRSWRADSVISDCDLTESRIVS